MDEVTLYGGIEAGGTKFRCAIGSHPQNFVEDVRFETRAPDQTLRDVCNFFAPYVRSRQISRIGIASFGPLDLDSKSPTFGYITSTPKLGWQNVNIRGMMQDILGVEVTLDTDVNGAALAEYTWGASRGVDPSLYLTVGTGIGGGLIKDGKPYHGLLSPEMGHVRIPHDLTLDPFAGACSFHADCLEGLASGLAIERRIGIRGELLPDDHPFWDVEAEYLAFGITNYIVTLSPKIITIGGGVMKKEVLWPKIRTRVQEMLSGYLRAALLVEHIERYIVPPALGDRAGVLGAIALASHETAE